MDGSGDGHLLCSDGIKRWGRYGAAGILFYSAGAEPHFLLVHRSSLVYHGDTWGIPGGALNKDESALRAAWREAREELGGLEELPYVVRGSYIDRPALDWSYTTVVIQVAEPFHLVTEWESEEAWETQNAGWFSRAEIDGLELHPAFAALWESGRLDTFLPGRPTLTKGSAVELPAITALGDNSVFEL